MFSAPLFLYPPSSTAGPLTQLSAECFGVIIVVSLLRRAGEGEMHRGVTETQSCFAHGQQHRYCGSVSTSIK